MDQTQVLGGEPAIDDLQPPGVFAGYRRDVMWRTPLGMEKPVEQLLPFAVGPVNELPAGRGFGASQLPKPLAVARPVTMRTGVGGSAEQQAGKEQESTRSQ
jgi:hypothetical protein